MTEGGQAPSLRDLLSEAVPRVLGAVTRRFGDFAAAEDAVQEALLAAHLEWPKAGAPANEGFKPDDVMPDLATIEKAMIDSQDTSELKAYLDAQGIPVRLR